MCVGGDDDERRREGWQRGGNRIVFQLLYIYRVGILGDSGIIISACVTSKRRIFLKEEEKTRQDKFIYFAVRGVYEYVGCRYELGGR